MTNEEAIAYFEGEKERLEAFRKMYPSPNTVGYQATTKEIHFYDMAISALSENKGDLISRQAVLDAIQKLNIPEDMCVFEIISHIEVAIATLPSVENKGEWVESKERSKHWYCSVCGGIHTDPETGKWRETFDYRYPFFPNCGADMRGGSE